MKKKHSAPFAGSIQGLIAASSLSVLMSLAGPAAAESWEGFKSRYDYDEAVHYMNKAYSQLGKVVNRLDEDQVDSATRHFNSANKDFDKALVYYADAVLPAEQKDAVNALKKGLDALQKTEKDLQNNNVVAAQNNYDSAQTYLAQASILLD